MGLREKVILITGGASGIGAAAADVCSRQGARVVIADIDETRGPEVASRIAAAGGQVRFVKTDITSEPEVRRLVESAESTFGRLNGLITSAGILRASMVPVEDLDEPTWQSVIDVNLKGTFLCVKHAVPALKRAGGGVVICVSSSAGVRGGSSSYAYGASKGGVYGLGLTLMDRLARESIRTHVVCPSGIDTPLKRAQIVAAAEISGESGEKAVAALAPDLGDPEGVGKVLAFLASDEAEYVRGTIFTR